MGDTPRKRGGAPAWRQQAGGGGGGADRRGSGREWHKEEARAPGSGGRRAKQLALLAAIGVVASIAVLMILWLWPAPQSVLVIVAANPADDADRLDVPLDLYGWRTAQSMIADGKARADREAGGKWGDRAPAILTDPSGNPTSLPADAAALADWANRFRAYDPVVIYLGLQASTTPADGPVLWVGGRNRIPIQSVFAALAAGDPGDKKAIRNKKKVLILDPGRLAPDPAYGHLHNDFAAQLKGLADEVAKCPNLVVLCGTDAGQRGWESEERGATAFGYYILRGLQGEAGVPESGVITARQLFEYAQRETEQFARDNRPSPQSPILLPEGEAGLQLAQSIQVAIKPKQPAPAPASPPAFTVPATLKQKWQQHDDLAARKPGPAAYAPRAWRRYRELLLRYEQAVRASEEPTAAKLLRAIDDAHATTVRSAALPPFDSAVNSLSFAALIDRKPGEKDPDLTGMGLGSDPKTLILNTPQEQAGFAARLLDQLAGEGTPSDQFEFAGRLENAVKLIKAKYDADQRYAEVHLPVMVREFYSTVFPSAGTVPGAWAMAVAVRRRAEEAALGQLPRSGLAAPLHAERVWPFVKPWVVAGDTRRRAGEDRLFASSPTDQKDAVAALSEAQTLYAKAVAVASDARAALEARDTAYADLPFLGLWVAANRGRSDTHADKLVAMWADVHALAATLDNLAKDAPPASATAEDLTKFADAVKAAATQARGLTTAVGALRDVFRADCDAHHLVDAALQGEWLPKEQLLATPLVPAEQRARILESSRRITDALLTGGKRQAGVAIGTTDTKADARLAAVTLSRLTRATLGAELLDKQHGANNALPKSDHIEKDLSELMTQTQGWQAGVTKVAAALAGHLRLAATLPELSGSAADAAAERLSRSTLALDRDSGIEPAAANLLLRWRDTLTAMADRSAGDHWYDERYDPKAVTNPEALGGRYYRAAANRYLADAGRITAALSASAAFVVPPALKTKLEAPPLGAPQPPPIGWTSEQRRQVQFAWVVPDNYPVTGSAVGVRQFTELRLLTPVDAAVAATRPLLPVAPAARLTLDAILDAGKTESVDADVSAAAAVYFRGQHPTQRQEIAVHRRPELILSDPRAKIGEDKAAFAIRAARDLDLGQISVVVDMSGSMKGDLKGVAVADWRNGPSKFKLALDALPVLLNDLPRGTPLRVRVFSDHDDPKEQSRVVYGTGGADDPAEVAWGPGNTGRLDELILKLRGFEPTSYTPLTRSILNTVENDFDNDRAGSRTIVLLTDGAEEEAADRMRSPAERLDRVKALRDRLSEVFRRSDIQLLVIRFALGEDDLQVSNALFSDLDTYKTPGRVFDARSQEQLRTALLDAIRPKLVLETGSKAPPKDYPRVGWPARSPDDVKENRYNLYWSPAVEAEHYLARAHPARRPTRIDLTPADGDRMILGFVRRGDGIGIRRELYADFFRELKDRVRFRSDRSWVATVPSHSVDDKRNPVRLRMLTHVEKVPGEETEDALVQVRPKVLWWDVAPVTTTPTGEEKAEPLDATVVVRKRYAFAAPAWDVEVDGWPRVPDDPRQFLPPRIRVWADDKPPPAVTVTCRLDETQAATAKDGDPLEIRVAVENHPLGPDGGVRPCLVVRVNHPPNKPVFVRYLNDPDHDAEHRYYRKANSYTALFGPVERTSVSGAALRLEVSSVAPLSGNDKASISLTLPPPRTETDALGEYRPRLGTETPPK